MPEKRVLEAGAEAVREPMALAVHRDDRGALVALECGITVPFQIERVYYIFDLNPSSRRGKHAHRICRQMAVCLQGECRFLLDDGRERWEVQLSASKPGAILIEQMVWHEMFDFSEGCVLMVLASTLFQKDDYIGDFEQFSAELADRY